jgi:hypothetical protein
MERAGSGCIKIGRPVSMEMQIPSVSPLRGRRRSRYGMAELEPAPYPASILRAPIDLYSTVQKTVLRA